MTLALPDLLDRGLQLEIKGETEKAAAVYQVFFENHPENTAVMKRLLILYRRLKEYRKEMRVIDLALATRRQVIVARQKAWAIEHPKAAKVSRALLKAVERLAKNQPGGDSPEIAALTKRKQLLSKRIKTK